MRHGQKKALKWVFYSLVLVLLPWLPVILSGIISSVFDCVVNEAGTNPCVVFGTDIGRTLYSMFVFGWVAVFITPILLLVFMFCLFWFIKELVFPREKRAK